MASGSIGAGGKKVWGQYDNFFQFNVIAPPRVVHQRQPLQCGKKPLKHSKQWNIVKIMERDLKQMGLIKSNGNPQGNYHNLLHIPISMITLLCVFNKWILTSQPFPKLIGRRIR